MLFPVSISVIIQRYGVGGTSVHACTTSAADFLVYNGKVICGIDEGQGTVAPQAKGIATVFAAVADACFRAGFPGPGMKGLVNKAGVFSFFHNS